MVTAAIAVTPVGAPVVSDEYTEELAFGEDESETYPAVVAYGEEGPTVVAPVPTARGRAGKTMVPQPMEAEAEIVDEPAPLPALEPAPSIKPTPRPAPPAAVAPLGVRPPEPRPLPPAPQVQRPTPMPPPVAMAPVPPQRPASSVQVGRLGATDGVKVALVGALSFLVPTVLMLGAYGALRAGRPTVPDEAPAPIPIRVSAVPERPAPRVPTAPAQPPVPAEAAISAPTLSAPSVVAAPPAPQPVVAAPRPRVRPPPEPTPAPVLSAPVEATVYRSSGTEAPPAAPAPVAAPVAELRSAPPPTAKALPAADAKLGGTFVGKYLNKPASLQIDFLPGGRVGGQLMVHEAGITLTTRLAGTYAAGVGGVATFAVVEQGVTEPSVLSGTLDGQTAEGKVTAGGRIRGRFYVRR